MKILFSLLALFSSLTYSVEPVVVVGGGVGGMTAALYLARAGLNPLLIEGSQPGGLITQSHAVQNWPGELEISGMDLAEKVRAQAVANGVRFLAKSVKAAAVSKKFLKLVLEDGKEILAKGVILAMGTKPNHLGIPGETGPNGYWGRGVTNCAVCDGALYKNQVVGVVGGGDAAVLEALYLSNIAKEVRVFVRKEAFKVVEKQRLKTLLEKSNVKVFFKTKIQEIKGNDTEVTAVSLLTEGKPPYEMALKGLFLAIGSVPNTEIFKSLLELDPKGYIVLKKDQETSLPGVYAVGDVVDPVYKQAISAAGDGAKAALQIEQYLAVHNAPLKTIPVAAVIEVESHVIEIVNVAQFEQELKASDGPVLVDFYASWCGPCRQVAPQVDRFSVNVAGKIKCLKVNVDTLQEIASRYRIKSMPTALLLDPEGNVLEQRIGSQDIIRFLDTLEQDPASIAQNK
ncbi:MAG TPA: FAD-dependent oxidoreductase [Chlamydiales bacterium]|jgi:thioredoxin reductase (NADPH)